MNHKNDAGLTLPDYELAVLRAEELYGLPNEIIDSNDFHLIQNGWQSNTDPQYLVDVLALEQGLSLPDDYSGDVLRYWLVLGRFEHQENQTVVVMAYDLQGAKKDFVQQMRADNNRQSVYIDLITSCGREYPEYSQTEEV